MAFDGTTYSLSTGANTENVVHVWNGTDTTPDRQFVGSSGGDADDHNNGALVIEAGEVPLIFYAQHSAENLLKYRIGTRAIEAGFGPFGDEQTIATAGGVTYPQVHAVSGVLHVLFRDALNYWTYVRSDDWAQTWTSPVRFLQHPAQSHLTSVVVGSTLRFVTSAHPDNGYENVYYGQINLGTGAVTKSDGTVLGNLDGTSLPIAVASLEVAGAPSGTHDYTWAYDVSDATDPEVVWVSWDGPDLPGTATYWYSKLSSGTWASQDVTLAGGRFSDASQPYIGGAQFPRSSPGGRVYTTRKDSGAWKVERQDTADSGATWTATLLATSPVPLVRAWPVEVRSGVATFEVVANRVTRFTSYQDMAADIVPVNPNAAYS